MKFKIRTLAYDRRDMGPQICDFGMEFGWNQLKEFNASDGDVNQYMAGQPGSLSIHGNTFNKVRMSDDKEAWAITTLAADKTPKPGHHQMQKYRLFFYKPSIEQGKGMDLYARNQKSRTGRVIPVARFTVDEIEDSQIYNGQNLTPEMVDRIISSRRGKIICENQDTRITLKEAWKARGTHILVKTEDLNQSDAKPVKKYYSLDGKYKFTRSL